MGCQTEVQIGHNLTFTITTHDPDTGVLTDADAVPSYRIYENETAAPILNGNMALLDAVNTTGFYAETIACTAANGFETGKSYNIYIEATVDGDTGGISYGFRAIAPVTTVAVAASLSAGEIRIVRGDTMDQDIEDLGDITTRAGAKRTWFTVKKQKDDLDTEAIVMITEQQGLCYLNGADVLATRAAEGTLTVTDAGAGDITVTLAATATDELVPTTGLHYDVQWGTGVLVTTAAMGPCRVTADVTRAVA